MARAFSLLTVLLGLILLPTGLAAQEGGSEGSTSPADTTDITGTWVTESGNLVEITLNGTQVILNWPAYARRLTATWDGTTLVYITHYRDTSVEECYINVVPSAFEACKQFIQVGDARHRFTLTLSPDGMVLSGTKEKNILQVDWDTDENGNPTNYRPAGYIWQYDSDYQWRRSDCDFNGLPSLTGNIVQRYELIGIFLDRYGLAAEFSLQDFVPRDKVKFVYDQCYIDADIGVFVPADEASQHTHLEPLDGRVILDSSTGGYVVELYPYAFRSYVTLLSGLTMLFQQYNAVMAAPADQPLTEPTTQMQLDSIGYAWNHRQTLCALDDEQFAHHIDFLSRALQILLMSGNR